MRSSVEKNARDIQLLREALSSVILGCRNLVDHIAGTFDIFLAKDLEERMSKISNVISIDADRNIRDIYFQRLRNRQQSRD